MNVLYLVIGALGAGLLVAIVLLLGRRGASDGGAIAGKIDLLERAQERSERMVREEKLRHAALRFFDLFALRGDDHAVGDGDRAGGLQLRHLLNAHQAHATRGLQREIGVVAERRDVVLVLAAHIDQARAFGDLKVFAVDGYFD